MSEILSMTLAGLGDDTADAMQGAAGAAAGFLETAAETEQRALDAIACTEAENAGLLRAIGPGAGRGATGTGEFSWAGRTAKGPPADALFGPGGGRPGIDLASLDLAGVAPETAGFIRYAAGTYGKRFVIHNWSPSVQRNIEQLSRVPLSVHERAAQFLDGWAGRGGIYIGHGAAPELDDLSYLAGERPRGWSEGATWAITPGAWVPGYRVLAIGTGSHGSDSLALHEFGHMADRVYGYGLPVSHDESWASTYRYVLGEPAGYINPYYRQAGCAGREELFAEAFARYHGPGPESRFRVLAGSQSGGQALAQYFRTLLGLSVTTVRQAAGHAARPG
jgi:hypothetical protein